MILQHNSEQYDEFALFVSKNEANLRRIIYKIIASPSKGNNNSTTVILRPLPSTPIGVNNTGSIQSAKIRNFFVS